MKQLLEPLQLGPITIPNRLVQAPLAGYSCAPFRVIAQEYGQPGFTATEMISAKDCVNQFRKPPSRYLFRDPREKILCYQLASSDPDVLARASAAVSDAGADIIDLNCGCPVLKVRKRGTGSKLLASPEKIHELVRAMKQNSNAAVSVKMRVAGEFGDSNDIAIADAIVSGGADFLIVHGRHWTERYDVDCRRDAIANIVKHVPIPVFANGDVTDFASAKRLLDETQCAGLMIGRAGVGDPWIYARLRAAIAGENFVEPDSALIAAVFKSHILQLAELDSEYLALMQSRKFAKYYARHLPTRMAFTIAAQEMATMEALFLLIDDHFLKVAEAD